MADKKSFTVETVFSAKDNSSRQLGEIERATKAAAKATDDLKKTLLGIGGAIVGSSIWDKAKSSLIGYNMQLENSKVQIAGMLTMFTGAPIEKAWDRAGVSVARFEQMAKKSSLTTKDLVETSATLTRPLLQAGLTMSQIEKLSFGAANASKAFGINGAVAAMDIEQALTTKVSVRDRFMRNLLAQTEVGMSADKFNKLGIGERAKIVEKALTTKAIGTMAKKQGEETMGGVLSTLEDNVQIFLGKVGMPLFKAITAEIKNWNQWIEKNSEKMAEFGRTIAQGLVSGFRILKDTFVFLASHADTLIMVAKAYAAIKIGSGLLTGANALIQGGAGMMGRAGGYFGTQAKDGFDKFGNYQYEKSTKFGRKANMGDLGNIGAVLGASYALGTVMSNELGIRQSLLEAIDPQRAEYEKLIGSMRKYDNALQEFSDKLKGKGSGATATQHYANAKFQQQDAQIKANILGDILGGRNGLGDKGALTYINRLMKLQEIGYDEGEAKKILKSKSTVAAEMHKQANLRDVLGARTQNSGDYINATFARVLSTLPKSQQHLVDQGKAMETIMREQLRAIRAGRFLTDDELKKLMLESNADDIDKGLTGKKPGNQYNTITIERVMAKDPNRWIADMDDQIQRRVRAPTRGKSQWNNSEK